jgi:hypothetical protein
MIKSILTRVVNLTTLLTLSIVIICPSMSDAQRRTKEKPQTALEILKYEWRSGGTGKQAVLKSITIHNKGKKSYENISLEVDLYSISDVPQGSIKSVINDNIPSGATKTFENVNFGLMNTDLQQTVFRITGADQVLDGELLPRDLILVKDWEWSGASYGTEGILKFITLENKSDKSYKDIEIIIESFNVGDKKTVPFKAYIKDVLPANSEQTYRDINVGFRYSGAGSTNITVLDAKRVSKKELRYRMAKKGVTIDRESEGIDDYPYDSDINIGDRNLTLAERYRKNVLKIDPESGKQLDSGISEKEISPSTEISPELDKEYEYYNESRYQTRIDNALNKDELLREEAKLYPKIFKEIVIVSASADEMNDNVESNEVYKEEYVQEKPVYVRPQVSENKNIFKRAINWSKDLVGLSEDEYDEGEYLDDQVAIKPDTESSGIHPYTQVEKNDQNIEKDVESLEDYELEGDEYQEPIPSIDIQVSDFKLNAALTSTIGMFEEITLLNNSRITYTNIRLEATSYAWTDRRPLASFKFTINEILPRRSKRTFKNVRLGFLSSEPEDLVIRVIDAINVN